MIDVGIVGESCDGDSRNRYVVLDDKRFKYRRVKCDIERTVFLIEGDRATHFFKLRPLSFRRVPCLLAPLVESGACKHGTLRLAD